MNILMFTNTYCPIVGGVSESVKRLKSRLQALGHQVLVVAPKMTGQPMHEADVIRVAAREKKRQHSPDSGVDPDKEEFIAVNKAEDALLDGE